MQTRVASVVAMILSRDQGGYAAHDFIGVLA